MERSQKHLIGDLRQHSQALALPHGRRVGQPGHEIAEDYLLEQMERMDLKPFHGNHYELTYELPHPNGGEMQKFTNLVGIIPGRDRSLPPILLGAHYDSVIDAPCVDDNATSVAHNLVLADHYSKHPLERDLIIAFFDAEEPPHFLGRTMGSRRFYEDYCRNIEFAAVIVTDLVGHDVEPRDLGLPAAAGPLIPHLRKLVAVLGAESHGNFPTIVEEATKESKHLRVLSTLRRYIGNMSDYAAFADAGQPFLFLSCGQGRYYHTPQDTMEWINFDKLAHITRFIANLVGRIDCSPPAADPSSVDPFEVEVRMLRKALGPVALAGLRAYGMKVPKSRKELDEFVSGLVDGNLLM